MHIIGIAILLLSIYFNNHNHQARFNELETGFNSILDIRDRVLSEDDLMFHRHILKLGIDF